MPRAGLPSLKRPFKPEKLQNTARIRFNTTNCVGRQTSYLAAIQE